MGSAINAGPPPLTCPRCGGSKISRAATCWPCRNEDLAVWVQLPRTHNLCAANHHSGCADAHALVMHVHLCARHHTEWTANELRAALRLPMPGAHPWDPVEDCKRWRAAIEEWVSEVRASRKKKAPSAATEEAHGAALTGGEM